MSETLKPFERVIDLFLCGKLPKLNHARHLAVANLLWHLPHGRALMHLGLQITAIRAGVPEKYSEEITNRHWNELDGALPRVEDFADVL